MFMAKLNVNQLDVVSGLEGRFGRPRALSKKLRECFDLMVEHGLLRTWRCDAIMPDSSGLLFEDAGFFKHRDAPGCGGSLMARRASRVG